MSYIGQNEILDDNFNEEIFDISSIEKNLVNKYIFIYFRGFVIRKFFSY